MEFTPRGSVKRSRICERSLEGGPSGRSDWLGRGYKFALGLVEYSDTCSGLAKT
jgi:hypothetical protein